MFSHAKHHSHQPGEGTLRRLEVQLALFGRQIADVEREMPALTAIRHNKHLKAAFLRQVQTRANKMIAITAVARKLLCLIFTLWKSSKPYDPNYSAAYAK